MSRDEPVDSEPASEPPTPPVEPLPCEPAAVARVAGERAVLIADYHAGIEVGLRYDRGVDVPSRASKRRERLLSILERTRPDRLVVLGDLMHSIGEPGGAERGELEVLFESLPSSLSVTLVKGNHDGAIETWLDDGVGPALEILPGSGARLGDVGVCHGHTWPAPEALAGVEVVCLGHEHPCVRLEDEVGGSRLERVWLRGGVDPDGFAGRNEYENVAWLEPEGAEDGEDVDRSTGRDPPALVVLPAFNELAGGTWVNVDGQSFLAPFLPDGIADAEAYLLDGTRLGSLRSI